MVYSVLSEDFRKELKKLLRETLEEFLDPDFGLELRAEVKQALAKSLEEKKKGKIYSFEEVKRELELV